MTTYAHRVHQSRARTHFAKGGSVLVSEYGHETMKPVHASTTVHNINTTSWDALVTDVRMWRNRYPNQRFYVITEEEG